MADSVTAKSAVAMILAIRQKRKKKRVRKRRFWVRDWLQCRQLYGAYHQLHQELDSSLYCNFLQSFCPIYWKDNSRNMSSNNRDPLRRLFESKINLTQQNENHD